MRFFPVIIFILISSGAFAGIPWMDSFESAGPWTTSAPMEDMLTDEYNVTVDSMSSRSLKLQNMPVTHRRVSRAGASAGDIPTTSAVSVWFYDDGEVTKSFNLGVQDTVPTSGGLSILQFSVGVRDGFTTTVSRKYVMELNGLTTPTADRSIGWHFVEFLSNTSGTRVLLDGKNYPGGHVPQLLRPETVVFETLPIDESSGAANAVWLDNAWYDGGQSISYSGQAGPWQDDMETEPGDEWDSFFPFAVDTVMRSMVHDHTTSSGYSMILDPAAPGMPIRRILELPVENPRPATFSFWFYDDGQTTRTYRLGVEAAHFNAGPGKLRGGTFFIGVMDGIMEGMVLNEYLVMTDMQSTPTGIARSTGWHLAEFSTTEDGLEVKLDGQAFADNFFPDFTRMTRVMFNALPVMSASGGRVWVDDMVYKHDAPQSAVGEWTLY